MNEEQLKQFSEQLQAQVFENRLVVYLEQGPQSNHYNQIQFSPEQFLQLSIFIGRMFQHGVNPDNGRIAFDVLLNTDMAVDLPEQIQSKYINIEKK